MSRSDPSAMPARESHALSYERVEEIADRLTGSGRAPTAEAVCRELDGADPAIAERYLSVWRRQRESLRACSSTTIAIAHQVQRAVDEAVARSANGAESAASGGAPGEARLGWEREKELLLQRIEGLERAVLQRDQLLDDSLRPARREDALALERRVQKLEKERSAARRLRREAVARARALEDSLVRSRSESDDAGGWRRRYEALHDAVLRLADDGSPSAQALRDSLPRLIAGLDAAPDRPAAG